MPSARDRQRKRRSSRDTSRRTSQPARQIRPEGRIEIPKVHIPGGKWLFIIPAGMLFLVIVIAALGLINPPDSSAPPNAIWLTADWTEGSRSTEEIQALARTLRENEIGHIYVYVASLNESNSWSGGVNGQRRYAELEPQIQTFIEQFRQVYPAAMLFAWVEVLASTPQGYRLDNARVQGTVAQFAGLMLSRQSFDGVMLDVKPLFTENEDYLALLREVRRSIGIDARLALAVPPDLTPSDTELTLPAQIAPGTEWGMEYKQRVALQADYLVIAAYNSYLDDPVHYIEWVTYQVDAYVNALRALETGTAILIGVPHYPANPPAHNAQIETLAAGIDGVRRGLQGVDETVQELVQGIAIFSDQPLSTDDWRIVRQKWLEQ